MIHIVKSKLVRWLGTLSLVVLFTACEEPQVAPTSPEVEIEFRARTVMGEPLAQVALSVHGAFESDYLSDNDGRVSVLLGKASGDVTLQASCPPGYIGESVEREISSTLLTQIAGTENAWIVDLVCQPESPQIPLLVFSEGCGELSLEFDGHSLGKTSHGAFQEIVARPQGVTAELRLKPESSNCVLEKSYFQLALSDSTQELFVHARGKKKANPRKSASPRTSAPTRRQPGARRPYRL